jgi:amino acid adenylation domain-containing protein
VEWNGRAEEFPQATIVELFEQQVAKTPETIALEYENQQLTYAELNNKANQLAHYLQKFGVRPEVQVGICVERSLDLVVSVLGVLKTGAAYLPLDFRYPKERLEFITEDAQVTVLISQRALASVFSQNLARLIVLEDVHEEIEQCSRERVESKVRAENLAYLIYTSGSTGKPKGVMVAHGNVARLMRATEGWFRFNEQDVWTMFHSYAFDFSVWELWGALLYGGRLVVVPYWVSRSPEAFYRLVKERGVTVLNQTPSAFQQFSQEDASKQSAREELKLRLVIFGGEALEMSSLQPWFNRHGDAKPRLVNMYGITETTVHVTYQELKKQTALGTASLIGARIPDLQLYILRDTQPVPVGVVGEMYVGGAGVARGYWNRAELTAERFVPHPFSEVGGERLYRTGDLGRYLTDGGIEYLGRMDHQVKIRGHRIELGEIEAVLEQHEAIKQAVVMAREDQAGDKRLVAYMIGERNGEQLDVSRMRSYLQTRLPEYMVPAALIILESMPLTEHGKLDRKALPRPEWKADEKKYLAPRNAVEKALSRVWSEVLGVERVGVRDNFFELGGDSIISIRILARCREAGLKLELRQLFERQTIERLAEVAQEVGTAEKEARSEPFGLISAEDRSRLPWNVEDAYPLSRLQMGMLFHSEYNSETPLYHDINSFHLRAPLQAELLRRAVEEVVERHEILRASFHISRYSQPLQCVHPRAEIEVEVDDLRYLGAMQQEEALAEYLEAEKHRAFDVGQPGLLRIHVHLRTEDTFQFWFIHHHVILDGWSVASLLTELFSCYIGLQKGGWEKRKKLSRQFRDFIGVEIDVMKSEEARRFWTDQLQGMETATLPWKKQSAVEAKMRALTVEIGEETSEALSAWAREMEVSVKSVLLAAHMRVLNLISGQRDVITGVTSNGRPESREGEQVLGLFLNSPPFRMKLSGGSWKELVQETARQEVAILPYRRYPLADIQMLAGGMNLFDITFNFVHYHVYGDIVKVDGVEVLGGEPFAFTNFTLCAGFMMDPVQSTLRLRLEYNSSLASNKQIEFIEGYYQKVLRHMVGYPNARYETADLLSEAERQQLLEWSGTAVEYSNKTVVELFEAQVASTPNLGAVIFGHEQLSYAELNERANQLAHSLIRLNVGPESLVGIALEPSIETVVSVLAAMKTGAAYLPLDLQYPLARLEHMVSDATPEVVIVRGHTPHIVTGKIIDLDAATFQAQLSSIPIHNPTDAERIAPLLPQHAAYVIYTSGSTGLPKGVVVTHAGIPALTQAQKDFTITRQSRVLQFASLNFDASLWEIVMTLTCGAALVLIEGERSGAPLRDTLIKHGVTHALLPLGVLASLEEYQDLPLECLINGGEALPESVVRQWSQGRRIFNAYGPTEATVYATVSTALHGAEAPPIGAPICNTRVYVLDGNLELAPIGAIGELYVAGPRLARGYLNRPELTAERFIADPFGPSGTRMYRTGDLARWRRDGSLEFAGRADEQVKMRGFRIELGEIEAVLQQHPAVAQAAVILRGERQAERQLAGFVVRKENNLEGGSSTLREYLRSRLPEYMVPKVIMEMESLPLTPNGKLDRRALARIIPREQRDEKTYVAPRTPEEEALAKIWAELLQTEQVGIYDNFFELGGHSLLTLQLVSRIRSVFAVDVPVSALFKASTVARMAEHIEQVKGNLMNIKSALTQLRQKDITVRLRGNDLSVVAGNGVLSPETKAMLAENKQAIVSYLRELQESDSRDIQTADRSLFLPLSSGQQRLWFLAQLDPESSAYVIPAAVRIEGVLQLKLLQQALNKIVKRHEVLRTVFKTEESEPRQVIRNEMAVPFQIVDLRSSSSENQKTKMEECIRIEIGKPFDLSEGPLLRAVVVQLGEQEHVLFLAFHHIVADGWSIPILVRELSALYMACQKSEFDDLPELPVQYADYAIWQRGWNESEGRARQLRYWEKQLAGLVPMGLPADHARNEQKAARGATAGFAISNSLVSSLKSLGVEEEATLFMVYLAAFKVLLSRYCNQSQIAVGTPVANRERREIQGLIGFFVNTLVMHTDVNVGGSFRDLLRQVKKTVLDAMDNQDLPFEQLVDHLRPERMANQNPLFQVMFILENQPQADMQLEDITLRPLELKGHTAKFDLTLNLVPEKGGLQGRLNYNCEMFEPASMERMIAHYKQLLESIAGQPDQSIDDLTMLTAVEREQLLMEWNQTGMEYPQETVVDLFEQQAERTPKAIAVEYVDDELTYAELNRQANQLAHYLQELGVGPEVQVGICVERSLELIVSLLGVLKAGAAYLPLDFRYPKERLQWMFEDMQPTVLVTQSKLENLLPPVTGKIIRLDTEWEKISSRSEQNPGCEVSGDNLAYTLYTSGSTGRPKASGIRHSSVTALVQWAREAFTTEELNGMLASTSICFDLSVYEIFAPLSWGGKVILPPTVLEIATMSTRDKVKVVNTCPSIMQEILRIQGLPQSVSTVNLAGEALTMPLVQQLYGIPTIKRVLNLYGPTEDTTYSTYIWIKKEDASERATVSIGRPITNTQMYVLDARMEPVPIGVAGELYIGGAGLARGYINRPELTAERFVANPFVRTEITNGERLYRTGDFVRWMPNGNLEFMGRLDDQVKIRGQRIELGEIEAVLQQHPAVAQAAVIARGEQQTERRLIGYVVWNENSLEGGSSALREYLRSRLPEYMVPKVIMAMENLPLTPNGKLDRRALAGIVPKEQREDKPYVAPRTPEEEAVAKIWAELLQLEQVGVHDNFFELGGHSLLAMQQISRVKKIFAVELAVRELFETRTLEGLAGRIEQKRVEALANAQDRPHASSVVVGIQPLGSATPFFCVHPVGGQVTCYMELSRQLGTEQPFYGLQSPPEDEIAGNTITIEEMAGLYCREILQVQNEGPYLLGGWSMGGLVAFEMTRQLKLSGREVALLALFDTYPLRKADGSANGNPEQQIPVLANFALDLARSLGKDWAVKAKEFLLLEPQQQWASLLEMLAHDGFLPREGAETVLEGLLSMFTRNFTARNSYVAAPQEQPTLLFHVAESHGEPGQLVEEWRGLTQESLEAHEIRGNHYTLLRAPHVSLVADILKRRIAQASESLITSNGSHRKYTISSSQQPQEQLTTSVDTKL